MLIKLLHKIFHFQTWRNYSTIDLEQHLSILLRIIFDINFYLKYNRFE
mgnify:CR=1 FL=1